MAIRTEQRGGETRALFTADEPNAKEEELGFVHEEPLATDPRERWVGRSSVNGREYKAPTRAQLFGRLLGVYMREVRRRG